MKYSYRFAWYDVLQDFFNELNMQQNENCQLSTNSSIDI